MDSLMSVYKWFRKNRIVSSQPVLVQQVSSGYRLALIPRMRFVEAAIAVALLLRRTAKTAL